MENPRDSLVVPQPAPAGRTLVLEYERCRAQRRRIPRDITGGLVRRGHYKHPLLMSVLSFLAMYELMYAMVNTWSACWQGSGCSSGNRPQLGTSNSCDR